MTSNRARIAAPSQGQRAGRACVWTCCARGSHGAKSRSGGRSPSRVSPEGEAVLADSVGVALLVVLETLTPAERLVFVLHDMFAVPFDEIAAILDRTPAAVR